VQDAVPAIDDVAFGGDEDVLTRRQEDFLGFSGLVGKAKKLQIDRRGRRRRRGNDRPGDLRTLAYRLYRADPATKMFLAVPAYLICSLCRSKSRSVWDRAAVPSLLRVFRKLFAGQPVWHHCWRRTCGPVDGGGGADGQIARQTLSARPRPILPERITCRRFFVPIPLRHLRVKSCAS